MPDLVRRRFRAPPEDGAALIDPPLAEADRLIAKNKACIEAFDRLRVISREDRMLARLVLISAASKGSGARLNEEAAKRPLVLGGHQPELFHPGVWFKNFVLSSIAKSVGGSAINLIIDSDTARSTSIRVPTRADDLLQVTDVPFDTASPEIPWEERQLHDEQTFRSFGAQVRKTISPLYDSTAIYTRLLIDDLWPLAIDEAEREAQSLQAFVAKHSTGSLASTISEQGLRSATLGYSLAGARHRLERQLGLSIWDAALGQICLSDMTFQKFAMHLLARHREFFDVHNAALAEYRRVNHVRSQSHPFPELAQVDDWLEMPLWVWSMEDLQRRRAFVRHRGNDWELGFAAGGQITQFAAGLNGVYEHFPFGETRGIQVRPRAVLTTMYARLVLSDLFIHGIGGAKYDELTDLIIRRFFGIEPPAYMTATATFRLPIERPSVSANDVRASARRIRDLRYQPESFVRDGCVTQDAQLSERLAALAAEKRAFLDLHDLRRCSKEVFERLDRLNRAMHDLLKPVEEKMRADHVDLVARLKQSQLLGSREFSFVLFPSEILPARLLDLCKVMS